MIGSGEFSLLRPGLSDLIVARAQGFAWRVVLPKREMRGERYREAEEPAHLCHDHLFFCGDAN